MPKKFKAKNKHKLDNPLRRKVLPPKEVINKIGIFDGDYIADVGCGIGYFTIPMAKVVGDKGKVYAIDISLEMLEETKLRVKEENLDNVEIIHSNENNFKIKKNSVNMVFTSTVFHELQTPEEFLKECRRILNNQGRLVILDWNKVEEEYGPPIHKRIEEDYVKEVLVSNGFNIDKVDYIGNSFYIIICKTN